MTRREVVNLAVLYVCGVAVFLAMPRIDPARLPDLWLLPAPAFAGAAIGAAWQALRAGQSQGDAVGIGLAWWLGGMIMGWSLIAISIVFGPDPGESWFERMAPTLFPYSLAPENDFLGLLTVCFFALIAIALATYALRKLVNSDD